VLSKHPTWEKRSELLREARLKEVFAVVCLLRKVQTAKRKARSELKAKADPRALKVTSLSNPGSLKKMPEGICVGKMKHLSKASIGGIWELNQGSRKKRICKSARSHDQNYKK
jgi:hypothetical protein